MNIKGLDYNTQRDTLMMPEYGREIQKMVNHAATLPDKARRQQCAETIVRLMGTKVQQQHENSDLERTLWDHLYLMSGKQLDIDWPFDVSEAEKITNKPEPMKPAGKDLPIRLRHYGRLVDEMLDKLKEMPEGEERDELLRVTANQMKRDLVTWGHGSMEDERVAADIERFTDGRIRLDLSTFVFEKINAGNDMPDIIRRKKRK